MRDGGPRSRARSRETVWRHMNNVRPALLDWSQRYDHLREVTRDDIQAVLGGLDVVNEKRDPFGIPGAQDADRVVVVPGETHPLNGHRAAIAAAVADWLPAVRDHWSAPAAGDRAPGWDARRGLRKSRQIRHLG
jgi:hypothetical protein